MNHKKLILFVCCIFASYMLCQSWLFGQEKGSKVCVDWKLAELISSDSLMRISGTPATVDGKYGKALTFNGLNDGLFLCSMPLATLEAFTIEALFYPSSGGNFEQRFFHTGEIRGDRVLLEIRSTDAGWYFDAFVQSGNAKMTLIEPKLLHPLDKWFHVAYVIDNGKLSTYIDGKKELEAFINFTPLQTGMTSIGVRLNEQSWFKGVIERIRITPRALQPREFLKK